MTTSWNKILELEAEMQLAKDRDAKREIFNQWMWYQFDGSEYTRHSNYDTLSPRDKDMWYDMVQDTIKIVKRNF